MQSVLNLKYKEKYSKEDFVVSESNIEAFNILTKPSDIEKWGVYPYPNSLIIRGPTGSGKTHLSNLWKESNYSGILIEDIDYTNLPQEELLHIFNTCYEEKKLLLITSSTSISNIRFSLNDLSSRIRSLREVVILEPDDYLLKMILFKHFSKRYIKIEDSVINYLAARMPRNFKEINRQMEILDEASLIYQRDITIPFIKKTLNIN